MKKSIMMFAWLQRSAMIDMRVKLKQQNLQYTTRTYSNINENKEHSHMGSLDILVQRRKRLKTNENDWNKRKQSLTPTTDLRWVGVYLVWTGIGLVFETDSLAEALRSLREVQLIGSATESSAREGRLRVAQRLQRGPKRCLRRRVHWLGAGEAWSNWCRRRRIEAQIRWRLW